MAEWRITNDIHVKALLFGQMRRRGTCPALMVPVVYEFGPAYERAKPFSLKCEPRSVWSDPEILVFSGSISGAQIMLAERLLCAAEWGDEARGSSVTTIDMTRNPIILDLSGWGR